MKQSELTAVFSETANIDRLNRNPDQPKKDLDFIALNGKIYPALAFFGSKTADIDVAQYQERFGDTQVFVNFTQRYKAVEGTATLETEDALRAQAITSIKRIHVRKNINDIQKMPTPPYVSLPQWKCDGHGGPASTTLTFDI